MKFRICFTFSLFFSLSHLLPSQTLSDFESFNLPPESFLNGSDSADGFSDGHIFLPNEYTAASDSWRGWSISNTTDTETPGVSNQYSAKPGGGAENSETYALAFTADNHVILHLQGAAVGKPVTGFYVANNTYAYESMRNGDSFAKRFGGVTGNDPDFFLLTIRKYLNGLLSEASKEIYLADYRFADNAADFIADTWLYVDFSDMGQADSLHFVLTSSDNGAFGMNTPAYFCLDRLTTSDGTAVEDRMMNDLNFRIYPNPVGNLLYVKTEVTEPLRYEVFDILGKMVLKGKCASDRAIEVDRLSSGQYTLKVYTENRRLFNKVCLFLITD